ncbi:MAG: DUF4157 domain-containing protein [Fimbriimonadaceae bacterium]|nr:DUF4157 domain-containing protein [Fimbriimonadaceae bacterium]
MKLAALILLSTVIATPQDKPSLDRHIYPLSKPLACPEVVIDTTDFPEAKEWAEAAKKVVTMWFPKVTELLSTADYKVPAKITLVFKKEISAPAYASGSTITVNGKWITEHPDDLGMMVHELTHVVQQYPGSRTTPGWLVEGIADYVRWWRYEPEAPRPKINYEKASYKDAYRTTAYFLAWTSRKYNMGLVPALDAACRTRKDPMPVFKDLTGKDADELWKEFIENKP